MNKITFYPTHFWDKSVMKPNTEATDEQWQRVVIICEELNSKYLHEEGCVFHPNKVQRLRLGLFNNFVDVQIDPISTCRCQIIVERLVEIRNKELVDLNPNYFKDKLK